MIVVDTIIGYAEREFRQHYSVIDSGNVVVGFSCRDTYIFHSVIPFSHNIRARVQFEVAVIKKKKDLTLRGSKDFPQKFIRTTLF